MGRPLDLERAEFASKCVREAQGKGTTFLDKYSNRAKSAPAEIIDNGLAQTLAFYQEKGDEYKDLAAHILNWLQTRGLLTKPGLESVLDLNTSRYRRATEEGLRLLEWIKRLAAAASKNGSKG